MSETGRKMDVEDVLSSIRRLVSEEARSVHDTPKPAASPKTTVANVIQRPEVKGPEKLVLTPSLRVPEALSAAPAAAEIEQRIADIESLVMSEAVESTKAEIARSVDVQNHEDDAVDYDDSGDDLDDNSKYDTAPQNRTAQMAEMVEDDGTESEGAVIETVAPRVVDPSQLSSNQAERDEATDMMTALHLSMRDFAREEPPLTANLSKAPHPIEPATKTSAETSAETVSDPVTDPAAGMEPAVEDLMAGIVSFDFVETEDPTDKNAPNSAGDDSADDQATDGSNADADFPTESPFQRVMDEGEAAEMAAPVKETIIDREPFVSAPPAPKATAQDTAQDIAKCGACHCRMRSAQGTVRDHFTSL